jgi:hypothetical protein
LNLNYLMNGIKPILSIWQYLLDNATHCGTENEDNYLFIRIIARNPRILKDKLYRQMFPIVPFKTRLSINEASSIFHEIFAL